MRENWVNYLLKIAHPVLHAASNDSLKVEMPVFNEEREDVQYLEAIGRLFCGMAPWLNSDEIAIADNQEQKEYYRQLFFKSIANLVDPEAKDYVDFGNAPQALVDTAYLAQGFLRAPKIWAALNPQIKTQLLFEIKKTRGFKPPKNNWVLFAAIIEAFLLEYDNYFIKKRLYFGVEYFVNTCYIGDGFYGDGREFAMDHYNSFVIQPMLTDILAVMVKHNLTKAIKLQEKHLNRFKRYLEIQERLISPEGTYPVFGRTMICRFGTFHALAQGALLQLLPEGLVNGQVRGALNAVLKQHMHNRNNFDKKGFLTIGFNGNQQQMAENYVSSGSPYHCTTIFLPLGLPRNHSFWLDKGEDWTSVKAFTGKVFLSDHAQIEISKAQKYMIPYVYKLIFWFRKIKSVFIKTN
ncbi:DUF2264 domain-containing protein [Neotamlana nanhaiensis]|uniref:DUF2264 domain-containing protein n=1 Tax=Neotamlana nanhaiensis TaxID=1382798 RepID=UPI00069AD141|nr:DUF2264 domain-containing protein [Tamlana nanhaiensis]